ncbi:hypothetical protein CPB83DRAFT_849736 [Crepidotus variabilis]|uniref:Uncharacterized protein n=1 Tax=Crepidotus variabilis TaxID=179855 RepID=A0A9P6EL47_9AGAR|nr:hypothetical protein CPB83DRAFT_849736 [Crepidotus variabilis]
MPSYTFNHRPRWLGPECSSDSNIFLSILFAFTDGAGYILSSIFTHSLSFLLFAFNFKVTKQYPTIAAHKTALSLSTVSFDACRAAPLAVDKEGWS